jgi:cytochrome c peroxidase
MRVADVLSNPAPEELTGSIAAELAKLDGAAAPPPPEEVLVDGLLHRNEWDLLAETTLPGAPPPDPTNAVADDPGAAALGKALFFDPGLSPSRRISCATCHDPRTRLSDGRPVAEGTATGDRRTPAIGLAAHARWQFWDGRADSLWAQALGPFENAAEMGSSRIFVARRVTSAHRAAYARAFPAEPLPETAAWPAQGKPGDPAFDSLGATERDAATRIFVNAGKAIAAYERTFTVRPNRLDAYLRGDLRGLDPLERYGLLQFARSGCMQCHWGPRLTDDAFHVTRTPTGRRDRAADRGRIDGVTALRESEFRSDGRWSDDPHPGLAPPGTPSERLLGQTKTPPLRGVADLSHFGHGGADASLAAVAEAYGRGGLPAADPSSAGAREPWLPLFGETVQWALVPFLRTLTADPGAP